MRMMTMKKTNAGKMMIDNKKPNKAQPKGTPMKIHQTTEPGNEFPPTAPARRRSRQGANVTTRTAFNTEISLSAMEDAFDQLTTLQDAICDLARTLDGMPRYSINGQNVDPKEEVESLVSCLYGMGDILSGVWADLEAEAEQWKK